MTFTQAIMEELRVSGIVEELAHETGADPVIIREMWDSIQCCDEEQDM